ncbi:activating signal cointegrator 1 complex subunit 2 isoform X2 [Tripterygium wilfordii]|nr:activating signal cointegrator 1 complex subunit 2 isoform X2 [Tripterygium wilfordii]
MVLYRISSNRDPGACASESLSMKDHVVFLQEKNLLDLPKLLDICAIYGHENEDLTRLLVRNALKAQPWIHDNMTALMSHFLGIVHTMHQRCSSSLEALFSPENREIGSSLLLADFIEVMDFINDAVASMDAFVAAYKPAAVFFSCPVGTSYGNDELLSTFARLHDSLLPSLRRGFQIIAMEGDGERLSNISMSLKMLSMRMVNLGWKLLDICYLGDEMLEDDHPIPAITKMFPADVEDPFVRADILVQTFREINGVSIQDKDNQKFDTFLQNVEKKYNVMRRLESLQNNGWVTLDDQQFHYLSGIMISASKGALIGSTLAPTPVPTNKVHMDEDVAITESKISQIKDLFPDYGKGFLAACLEAYNHNPEEVIQRILEGTLHEDLQCLDSSLETIPLSKSDPAINSKDKGKGKLVESTALPSIKPVAVAGGKNVDGPSVSSSSTVGRFVRKSKDGSPDDNMLDARNENNTAKTAALISQYEYEDEYDDSFDDLGLSIGESRLDENEMMGDSVTSNMGKAWPIGAESSAQTAPNSKWGSRRKPQFYVKDGKNYSYKVAGSVAVANADDASIVTQAQGELIHGLGRGGNLPLGAVKKLMEREEQYNKQSDVSNVEEKGNTRNMSSRGGRGRRPSEANDNQDRHLSGRGGRGRRPSEANDNQDSHLSGRGGSGRRPSEANDDQDSHSNNLEGDGREDSANQRGRGGRRGGGRNNYRKDRAMKKHFAGLSGY